MTPHFVMDAAQLAVHVEALHRVQTHEGNLGALWLLTLKSTARALDFDTRVVSAKTLEPLSIEFEARIRATPTCLGGMGSTQMNIA